MQIQSGGRTNTRLLFSICFVVLHSRINFLKKCQVHLGCGYHNCHYFLKSEYLKLRFLLKVFLLITNIQSNINKITFSTTKLFCQLAFEYQVVIFFFRISICLQDFDISLFCTLCYLTKYMFSILQHVILYISTQIYSIAHSYL